MSIFICEGHILTCHCLWLVMNMQHLFELNWGSRTMLKDSFHLILVVFHCILRRAMTIVVVLWYDSFVIYILFNQNKTTKLKVMLNCK